MFLVFLFFLFLLFSKRAARTALRRVWLVDHPRRGVPQNGRREHSILYIIFFLFAANARLDDSES